MAMDYGVRQGLKSKGFSDDDIGFDPNSGYVQVKGQNFIKPEMNVNGTTFTSQDNFNNAYNQYNKNQRQQQQQTALNQYVQNATNQTQQANPYADQYTKMISDIMTKVNAPQQDVYSTPQYVAAQAQADRSAQQGIRSAQEALGTAGFGRSTTLGNAAQRSQNDANEYLQLQMVPQIQQQLAAQRQAEINNQVGLLNPVLNMLNREDTNVRNRNADLLSVINVLNGMDQQGFNNEIAQAQVTGNYLPQEARGIIDSILGLKQQAESGNVNQDQLQGFRTQADQLRSRLAMMGIDPNVVGYESDYNQALQNVAGGFPTMQRQNQTFNQNIATQQQDLNNTQVMAQLTGFLPDGTPTNAKQQQDLQNEWIASEQTGRITDNLANLYGIPRGTPTQAAKQFAQSLAIQQQNANTSAAGQSLARDRFAWDKDPSNPDNIYKNAQINKLQGGEGATITPKLSSDNYTQFANESNFKDWTKDEIQQTLQNNSENFVDADYKAANKWINDPDRPWNKM